MPTTKSASELRALRDSVRFVGRLSDGLVRIGPFSVGLDGVLSWIPGLGELYSSVAAIFLLAQGVRAGVAAPILALAGLLLSLRTLITALPLAGPAAADLFTAHRWAAGLIIRAIDRQLGEVSAVDSRPPAWPQWPRTGPTARA